MTNLFRWLRRGSASGDEFFYLIRQPPPLTAPSPQLLMTNDYLFHWLRRGSASVGDFLIPAYRYRLPPTFSLALRDMKAKLLLKTFGGRGVVANKAKVDLLFA